MSATTPFGEFDLIGRIRARAAMRSDVVLGIGDDAAILRLPANRELVVAMDTLNAGVHFPADAHAADIGWKALAVNLSDLAAMGAEPAWCTLSLSLPDANSGWIDAFLDGFDALAHLHGVALVGGDTTRGPLSISVTAHGFVQPGRAMRRSGASAGDDVWVTGTLGDAAAALALRGIGTHAQLPRLGRVDASGDAAARAVLETRLARPAPRIDISRELAVFATACIDISDGLLADLGHVSLASAVEMSIDADALPASRSLVAWFDAGARRDLQLSGGDDYELAFTAPPSARDAVCAIADANGTELARIGRVTQGSGVRVVDSRGEAIAVTGHGYQHFA